jgi:ribosomal protein S16
LDIDRINHWVANGAQPTETVSRLIRSYKPAPAAPAPVAAAPAAAS